MHLLRNIPPVMNDRRVTPETVVRLLRFWRRRGYDWSSWTTRRPRRLAELEGGSVYFVCRGETLFRCQLKDVMPVSDVAPDASPRWRNGWALVCDTETIMVESKRVHRLQGWRYLEPAEAPADIPADHKDNNA